MKLLHCDLVKAGMERTRQQGKRIGRPRVTERPEFTRRLANVMELISLGTLSRRKAATELAIGYATLKRLIDSKMPSLTITANESVLISGGDSNRNVYAEVL